MVLYLEVSHRIGHQLGLQLVSYLEVVEGADAGGCDSLTLSLIDTEHQFNNLLEP